MDAGAGEGSAGALLRRWRERALLTQEQLAERAGVNARTIRRLESDGGMRPQSATLRLLATALDLSAAERDLLAAAARGGVTRSLREEEVPRQLPAPPPGFTGRTAELVDLDRVQDATAVVITAIDGMAGIGKTALAVHAAHRLAGHYPDGQLFLDLHGHTDGMPPVDPGEALDRLLRALGVPGQEVPQHVDERAALYRSRLAGRKVLVLLDNAASESQVAPLLPGSPGCLVLVTSRRRLTGLDHTRTLSLDVLPPADAVALLVHSAGTSRTSGAPPGLLAEAVELCGRLPLAVRIAAARLRSRAAWTVADLVDRLRDHRHRLGELEAGRRSVTAALDLSYRQLEPDLRRAYRLLGLHPGADLDVHAAAALVGTTPAAAGRSIDRLLEVHLLQEPAAGRYLFHDLVRAHATAAAGDETEDERRAAITRLLDHYRHAASVAMHAAYPYERPRRPAVPPSGTATPDLADAAAAGAWLDGELANLLAVARYAADQGSPRHALDLSATLHRHLRGRARYTDAEALHGLALATARAAGDRGAEQVALTDLGHISRMRGRNEQAAERYARALAVGPGPAEVWALVGIGHVHRLQGRYRPAVESFEQALEIARDSGDRSGELDALTGLGWLRRQRGEPARAVESFERALEIARDMGNRSGELDALTGLGWLRRQRGEPARAVESFGRALEIARDIGNRHGELNALTGLAAAHRLGGRHDLAAADYERTLVLAREIGNRNLQFEALQGMGRLSHAAGRPDEALAHHRQALELAVDLGQPADEARAHDGIAHAWHALGRAADARRHWHCALDVLTRLGTDHTEEAETTTATIRARLAELGP